MRLIEQGRTRLLGAAIGTCLVTAVGVSSAFAQEATPVPTDQATPSAQTAEATPGEYRATAAEKTMLAELIQRVTDTIATVQADRDAVGGTGDWTAVDDLLAKATQLRDAAKATLETDDLSPAHRQLFAAESAAMAAESLIRAQLSDYGLPSQQAGASRTLVAAYNQIDEISARVNEGTDENAKGFATTAQTLYRTAYDLYNAGTYAQAARTAEVASRIAGIAAILSAEFAGTEGTVCSGGEGTVQVEPATGQDVVIVEGRGGKGEFGPNDRVPGERGEARAGGEPTIEFVPGFSDKPEAGVSSVVVLDPFGKGSGFTISAGGADDFSTESPLEVPAPNFD